MPEEEKDYYVLFHNHTEGLELYQYVRSRGISVKISPTPRVASVCCGMSLLVGADAIAEVRQCIEASQAAYDRIVALPRQIDPHRDKFC
jgi:hypothetical protein